MAELVVTREDRKWRSRFVAGGVSALLDEPRSGAPRRISDEQVEAVVVKTLESTPQDATQRQYTGVLLAFSCVMRAQVCGERIAEEPRLLQAAAGKDVRTFGFYSYGEYGRSRSVLGTHNASLTALFL